MKLLEYYVEQLQVNTEGIKDKIMCWRSKVAIKSNRDSVEAFMQLKKDECKRFMKDPVRFKKCKQDLQKHIENTKKRIAKLIIDKKRYCKEV